MNVLNDAEVRKWLKAISENRAEGYEALLKSSLMSWIKNYCRLTAEGLQEALRSTDEDDLVQRCLLRIDREVKTNHRDYEHPQAFLKQIVRNTCADAWREGYGRKKENKEAKYPKRFVERRVDKKGEIIDTLAELPVEDCEYERKEAKFSLYYLLRNVDGILTPDEKNLVAAALRGEELNDMCRDLAISMDALTKRYRRLYSKIWKASQIKNMAWK